MVSDVAPFSLLTSLNTVQVFCLRTQDITYLLRGDSIAALLSATRRIREGRRFGALEIRVRHLGCPTAAKITCQHGDSF